MKRQADRFGKKMKRQAGTDRFGKRMKRQGDRRVWEEDEMQADGQVREEDEKAC